MVQEAHGDEEQLRAWLSSLPFRYTFFYSGCANSTRAGGLAFLVPMGIFKAPVEDHMWMDVIVPGRVAALHIAKHPATVNEDQQASSTYTCLSSVALPQADEPAVMQPGWPQPAAAPLGASPESPVCSRCSSPGRSECAGGPGIAQSAGHSAVSSSTRSSTTSSSGPTGASPASPSCSRSSSTSSSSSSTTRSDAQDGGLDCHAGRCPGRVADAPLPPRGCPPGNASALTLLNIHNYDLTLHDRPRLAGEAKKASCLGLRVAAATAGRHRGGPQFRRRRPLNLCGPAAGSAARGSP